MEDFNKTLDNIESALSDGTINEGQYLKLMDLAKKRFEKQNKQVESCDDEEEEYESASVEDEFNDYLFVKTVDKEEWLIGEYRNEEFRIIIVFSDIDSAKSYWNTNIIRQPSH